MENYNNFDFSVLSILMNLTWRISEHCLWYSSKASANCMSWLICSMSASMMLCMPEYIIITNLSILLIISALLTHLSKVKRFSKLVLSLLYFLVRNSSTWLLLPLLAVIVELPALQLLPVVGHLLQVLGLEVVEGLQIVLLHIVIQGVLQVCHSFQCFTRFDKRRCKHGPVKQLIHKSFKLGK